MSKPEKKIVQKAASIPPAVLAASNEQWGVLIDAYLFDAVPVENRFAATAYFDRSGTIDDGSTVATPPVRVVERRESFVLLQTLCGSDYYVITASRSDGTEL
ncbi:hypothetical protein [Pseudomonas coronafaciens]|uniref:hypothetical protein n=1 Tax=Pseudomonas coronafaciens TaxID=53409 RepID=UPI0006D622EE|nr:hypothetical protein [Pseudomonas coronafaciens]